MPLSIVEQTRFANIVCRVVITHEGKFLMVQEAKRNNYGRWTYPGGKVDVGERLSEAALREVWEETGIEVELTGVVSVHHVLWRDEPGFSLQVNFLATPKQADPHVHMHAEILVAEWKTLAEIDELIEQGNVHNESAQRLTEELRKGSSYPLELLQEFV